MNQTPDPSDGGANKSLLEVAADELVDQHAPLHQVLQEMLAGDCHRRSVGFAETTIRPALRPGEQPVERTDELSYRVAQ